MYCAANQPTEKDKQAPATWTSRELEFIDEMIVVQLNHADRCDNIRNSEMAKKQKQWDLERVAILQKAKGMSQREWVGLTDEERYLGDARSEEEIEYARAIEAKLKEKNA
jgi:hypothetical protein